MEYGFILATMYNYLDNKRLAKKFAEQYIDNFEGVNTSSLHIILRDIYTSEGNSEKAELHINKLKEIEALSGS